MGKKYGIIYADPPWEYRDKASAGERGSSYKYPVLDTKEIAKLEISKLAAENCILFLWATWPLLPDIIEVMKSWGFKFKTKAFTWVKTTKNGKLHWGMGNYTRANDEVVLLGVRGKPKRVSAAVHSVVMAPIGKHSEKPQEVRDRIEKLMGDIPKVELFARIIPPGWDVIGLEIDGRDIREVLETWDDNDDK
jgi:N6-adenosine-specific RNA methylase IME4